jgi:hypothetical protein
VAVPYGAVLYGAVPYGVVLYGRPWLKPEATSLGLLQANLDTPKQFLEYIPVL